MNMIKKKIIYANCSMCRASIAIEVPEDIAKNREIYPFEYIDIHGDPEHALMLFLDQNLSVRDSIVYKDLKIAQQKGKQFQKLIRMSEIDALAAIYMEPLRLQIFKILTEGPQLEEDLLDLLKNDENFREEEFNMLMLPLIKTELVKSSWLKESFQVCYFLIKDFSVFRVPSKIVSKIVAEDKKFKPYNEVYKKKVNEVLLHFKQKFLSSKESQIEEIRLCLELRSTLKYMELLFELGKGPQTLEHLSEFIDNGTLRELIEKDFVMELNTKTDTYYVLLTDIKIKKFTPKYLVNAIANKLNNDEITHETAMKQLEFLYESEVTS